ncbi:MAG: hypothetical protein ACI8R9_002459 [Paraglaciecola sp.]|jgi:hypothetical protein
MSIKEDKRYLSAKQLTYHDIHDEHDLAAHLS